MAVINICDNYSEYLAMSFIKLAISQHRMMRTDLCLYFFGLPFAQFYILPKRDLISNIGTCLNILT